MDSLQMTTKIKAIMIQKSNIGKRRNKKKKKNTHTQKKKQRGATTRSFLTLLFLLDLT